jgi:hypothetical protein
LKTELDVVVLFIAGDNGAGGVLQMEISTAATGTA